MWIGPQQEKQPGAPGTGCSFLFPVDMNCSTQPRVTVTGITLEDITFLDGHTLPGTNLIYSILLILFRCPLLQCLKSMH